MSQWIDKLSQEIEKKELHQQHLREALPIKAEEFWHSLVNTLEQDVRQINEKFQHRIGEVDFRKDDDGSVHIHKSQFPAYQIDLVFLGQVPTIRVASQVTDDAQAVRKGQPYNINFKLDQSDAISVSAKSFAQMTLSSVSEMLLAGMAQNKPAQ